jgi:hypothetical protein
MAAVDLQTTIVDAQISNHGEGRGERREVPATLLD